MTTAATTTTETALSPMIRRSRNQHNANAIRHGMRGSQLPPGCSYIEKAINHFRRQLEKAVLDARGEITLVESAAINSAFRFERLAQLAQRWLVANFDELTHGERLAYASASAKASVDRDKCISALKLDQPVSDLWNGSLLPGLGLGDSVANAAVDSEPQNISTGQQAAAGDRNAPAAALAGPSIGLADVELLETQRANSEVASV